MQISIADGRSDAAALASLFRRNLTAEYISHSELQGPRALAPGQWVADIEAVLHREISERLKDARQAFPTSGVWFGVLEAREAETLVGIAFVTVNHEAAVPFGIIEDVVVETSLRGGGRGRVIMEWISDAFRAAGLKRAFLESGLHNESAHHLFERLGFETVSIVMKKDL